MNAIQKREIILKYQILIRDREYDYMISRYIILLFFFGLCKCDLWNILLMKNLDDYSIRRDAIRDIELKQITNEYYENSPAVVA